jgi:hypothetical protein
MFKTKQMKSRNDLTNNLTIISNALIKDKSFDNINKKMNMRSRKLEPIGLMQRNTMAFSGKILRGRINKRDRFNLGLTCQLM